MPKGWKFPSSWRQISEGTWLFYCFVVTFQFTRWDELRSQRTPAISSSRLLMPPCPNIENMASNTSIIIWGVIDEQDHHKRYHSSPSSYSKSWGGVKCKSVPLLDERQKLWWCEASFLLYRLWIYAMVSIPSWDYLRVDMRYKITLSIYLDIVHWKVCIPL